MSSLSSATGTGPSLKFGCSGGSSPTSAVEDVAGVAVVGDVGVAGDSVNCFGDPLLAVWNVSDVLIVELGDARGSRLRLRLEQWK